jgi:hypothetical protein
MLATNGQYEFSFVWWVFRFVTLAEVVAIVYLFASTWKLSKSIEITQSMMEEIIEPKKQREVHSGEMLRMDQKFSELYSKHKRNPEND